MEMFVNDIVVNGKFNPSYGRIVEIGDGYMKFEQYPIRAVHKLRVDGFNILPGVISEIRAGDEFYTFIGDEKISGYVRSISTDGTITLHKASFSGKYRSEKFKFGYLFEVEVDTWDRVEEKPFFPATVYSIEFDGDEGVSIPGELEGYDVYRAPFRKYDHLVKREGHVARDYLFYPAKGKYEEILKTLDNIYGVENRKVVTVDTEIGVVEAFIYESEMTNEIREYFKRREEEEEAKRREREHPRNNPSFYLGRSTNSSSFIKQLMEVVEEYGDLEVSIQGEDGEYGLVGVDVTEDVNILIERGVTQKMTLRDLASRLIEEVKKYKNKNVTVFSVSDVKWFRLTGWGAEKYVFELLYMG